MFIRHEFILCAEDVLYVFASHEGGGRLLHGIRGVVRSLAHVVGVGMIKRDKVMSAPAILQPRDDYARSSAILGDGGNAFPLCGFADKMALPIIGTCGRIHIVRGYDVILSGEVQIEVAHE